MLLQAKRKYGNQITGPVGVLSINVIRAENLVGVTTSHVSCLQGNKQGQTKPARGNNPIYADGVIKFEVDDDSQALYIQMIDVERGQELFIMPISFDDIKSGQVPRDTEFWLNVDD